MDQNHPHLKEKIGAETRMKYQNLLKEEKQAKSFDLFLDFNFFDPSNIQLYANPHIKKNFFRFFI